MVFWFIKGAFRFMKCSFYFAPSIIETPAAEIQNKVRDAFFLAFKRKGKGEKNPFPRWRKSFPALSARSAPDGKSPSGHPPRRILQSSLLQMLPMNRSAPLPAFSSPSRRFRQNEFPRRKAHERSPPGWDKLLPPIPFSHPDVEPIIPAGRGFQPRSLQRADNLRAFSSSRRYAVSIFRSSSSSIYCFPPRSIQFFPLQ